MNHALLLVLLLAWEPPSLEFPSGRPTIILPWDMRWWDDRTLPPAQLRWHPRPDHRFELLEDRIYQDMRTYRPYA